MGRGGTWLFGCRRGRFCLLRRVCSCGAWALVAVCLRGGGGSWRALIVYCGACRGLASMRRAAGSVGYAR